MDSALPNPPRARLTSTGVSVLLHGGLVALLLLLGGPVWQVGPRPRPVTPLYLPTPRPVTLSWKRPVAARPRSTPIPLAVPPLRPTAIPTRAAVRPRIEPAPEVSTPTQIPAVAMPTLAAKRLVEVGLLDAKPAPLPETVKRATGSAGFDRGAEPAAGGSRRAASVGFDDASPVVSPVVSPRRGALTQAAGFDQSEPAVRAALPKVSTTPFEALEILEKPRPVYTEEARRLRIEGTVQLRVVFGAAGQIRVVDVVKGLGHGLDEAAVSAAQAIRYRPARRDGRPVDSPAVIQIQFQIA
ncbi:MAG: TonB family protein [Bryobacteraceae bacterium]|nr:TonB family protein [Bryobacteraceae bacterium]